MSKADDPPRFPPDVAQELFYVDADGNRRDAGFHNEILDQGDFEAAKRISDKVKARILAKAKQEKAWDESKHPREPAGGPEGGQFAGGGGEADDEPPSSWGGMSNDRQDAVKDAWKAHTFPEFRDSEIERFHESGEALDQAKWKLADDYQKGGNPPRWAEDAMLKLAEDRSDEAPSFPFDDTTILNAVLISYERNYEGTNDPEITFDDKMLRHPEGYDPSPQFPGIEPENPANRLTPKMRDEISSALAKAFDKEADNSSSYVEPPSTLAEQIDEQQDEYFDQLSNREKFKFAKDHGLLTGTHEVIVGGKPRLTQVSSDEVEELNNQIHEWFPNINSSNTEVITGADRRYNCVAWAMGDDRKWWWPGSGCFWPQGFMKDPRLVDSFDALLIDEMGGITTNSERVENGFIKLALFAQDGEPTHLVRQEPDGKWSSKLGGNALIRHDLHEMEGGNYGNLEKIYKLKETAWKRLRNLS